MMPAGGPEEKAKASGTLRRAEKQENGSHAEPSLSAPLRHEGR